MAAGAALDWVYGGRY